MSQKSYLKITIDMPDADEIDGFEVNVGKMYAVRARLAKHVVYLADDASDRHGCCSMKDISMCGLVRHYLVG